MNAIDCIKGRRSVREYTDQDISSQTLRQIIETTSFAPSWKNSQTVSYVAIKNQELKEKIANFGVMGFTPNMHRVIDCNTLIAVLTQKGFAVITMTAPLPPQRELTGNLLMPV